MMARGLRAAVLIPLLHVAMGISVNTQKEVDASKRPSVRMILTTECNQYDLMVPIFAHQTQKALGNIPITLIEACGQAESDLKDHMPPNTPLVDEVVRADNAQRYRERGRFTHTQWYPWVARPYSVADYVRNHDFKEDVIVVAEYDWVWTNPDNFWEVVAKVAPNKPVGVEYTYLLGGINDPNMMIPQVPGKDKTRARKLLDQKDKVSDAGVPMFITPTDLKKMADGWAVLTDDILAAQDASKAANLTIQEGGNWRMTEMYGMMLGAVEQGMVWQVERGDHQFAPGYGLPKDVKPLFGHYQYAYSLCGKVFDKRKFFEGHMKAACGRLPDESPPTQDINSCEYKEVFWNSGGGEIQAKQEALMMWQETYNGAQEVCRSILAPPPPPPVTQKAAPPLPPPPSASAAMNASMVLNATVEARPTASEVKESSKPPVFANDPNPPKIPSDIVRKTMQKSASPPWPEAEAEVQRQDFEYPTLCLLGLVFCFTVFWTQRRPYCDADEKMHLLKKEVESAMAPGFPGTSYDSVPDENEGNELDPVTL